MYCKNELFKNSIIYKLFLFVMKFYNNSKTSKLITNIETWSRNSFIYKTFNNYAMKNSKAKYSCLYKTLSFIGKKFDKIVGTIHNFFKNIIVNSYVYSVIVDYKKEKENPFLLIGFLIISFNIGYLITSLISNTLTANKKIFISISNIIGILSIFKGKYLIELSKESVVYRIYKYIID
ncbi:MAG: hypothetical protein FH751_14780 [Firmicutes bacterium]|nr:hypothetical protein [Bacillota bacterium]